MKLASLDLGSNTFLLLITEVVGGEIKEVLHDEVVVVRMAEGVHATRELQPQALIRIEDCFKSFKQTMDKYQVEKVVTAATSAARDVNNADVFRKLGEKYNIPIQIISGPREAELTYLGAGVNPENAPVIDVGGGSTEIIQKVNGQIIGCSLDVGAVRLHELFVTEEIVKPPALKEIDDYILAAIEKSEITPMVDLEAAIAVAGTPTTLACVMSESEYDAQKIHNYEISIEALYAWRDRLFSMTIDERKLLKGMPAKRADIIPVGVSILAGVLSYMNIKKIKVSTLGVRYGLAMDTKD